MALSGEAEKPTAAAKTKPSGDAQASCGGLGRGKSIDEAGW